MGSIIEINDTLQITREQGFPDVLQFDKHCVNPVTAKDFIDTVFSFKNKPGIRVYKLPPVRNFLVENVNGKWLYWGHIHMLSVEHDIERNMTSGTFRIEYIFTPEEMKHAHAIIDRNVDTNFFR